MSRPDQNFIHPGQKLCPNDDPGETGGEVGGALKASRVKSRLPSPKKQAPLHLNSSNFSFFISVNYDT